ncbi:MAG: hypothetical protein IMF09_08155, partial [Proteobacteria bacterium]|nr:hypothetical protein [Pseudomonadota bacterium]
KARQLTNYRRMPVNGRKEYFIGNLIGGQSRRLAFLVDFPAHEVDEVRNFTCTASWLDAETAIEEQHVAEHFEIAFVPASRFDKRKRDKEVAQAIADLWMARQGYDAMMLNERGQFSDAVASIDSDDLVFNQMVEDLPQADAIRSTRQRLRSASASRWDGMSKKEAMTLARKRMRQKPDFRSNKRSAEWSDYTQK